VSVNNRIEAETRNVQTLVKAGSLEDAAASACDLFEKCQEAGLLVSNNWLSFLLLLTVTHTASACVWPSKTREE
jgi:hypothetical protein